MKTLFKQITQKLSENKDRHTDLKKTVKSKVAIEEKLAAAKTRQRELAIKAACENFDTKEEVALREDLRVQRAWMLFMQQKMSMLQAKNTHLEAAFEKLKNETGIVDMT